MQHDGCDYERGAADETGESEDPENKIRRLPYGPERGG